MRVRYFAGPTPPTGRINDGDRWNDAATGAKFRFRAGQGWMPFVDERAKNVWSDDELAILRQYFPVEGENCADRLPRRNRGAVQSRARHDRLLGPLGARGTRLALSGPKLEEALGLRRRGWSYERIGQRFGICEGAATNVILITSARRSGRRLAERDQRGELTAVGVEQIRELLRKGLKGRDIQERLGVSAGTVSTERKRYNADLKLRGKRQLPPVGAGERYSGAKIPRERWKEIEALFMEGYGTQKIVERTGASHRSIQRLRVKLVKRLRRRGECLPGCDAAGVRRVVRESEHFIPEAAKQRLRELLLQRVSVRRAAREAGVGGCSAYRLRDALAAELRARGDELLPPIRRGPTKEERDAAKAVRQALAREADAVRRSRPLSFEEQLARVRAGARLAPVLKITRADPAITLGGVATGAL